MDLSSIMIPMIYFEIFVKTSTTTRKLYKNLLECPAQIPWAIYLDFCLHIFYIILRILSQVMIS